ncbi:HAD family hydrolase [uncultured Pseudokineococcus sp.]|uniref:HAD family hydrolase n=1 Tax=uncultured Pseudokineococcus sp. TaxID=1642928 RepID=UPI0026153843|nr:HAD family hydrolase [uncultured Pseudokineococcus sp.]
MPAPPLVLLDLDGTLLDHRTSVRLALERWTDELRPPRLPADLHGAWLAAEQRHYPAWREGSASFAEQRRRRLRDVLPLLGLPVGDDDELDAVFTGYLTAYEAAWTAFPDVDAALEELAAAGLRTAVLTNGVVSQQRAKLAAIGLRDRVGTAVTAEELGVAKPDPRAFARACARLGRAAAEVVSVGDDHALDVVAARAAGLRAVHLDRRGEGPADEAHRTTTLRGLADLVLALPRPPRAPGPTG